jgi:pimeloyl-ACP methyl ester carboxylesterase
MKRVRTNEVHLAVDEKGTGEPLVLVHGSWSDRHVWDLLRDTLAESFRVISYDRRGNGESDRATATRSDHEDDLAGLIEEISDEQVRLVGTSFGGSIALGLTSTRPDLVRQLVVHEPPLISMAPGDPETLEHLTAVVDTVAEVEKLVGRGDPTGAARLFVEEVALGPGAWETLPPPLKSTMIDSAESFVVEQRDPNWAEIDRSQLAGIATPTLLTRGEESPPWFSAIVAGLEESIDDALIRDVEGAGHAPHLTHPTDYLTVLSGFLTGSPAPAVGA